MKKMSSAIMAIAAMMLFSTAVCNAKTTGKSDKKSAKTEQVAKSKKDAHNDAEYRHDGKHNGNKKHDAKHHETAHHHHGQPCNCSCHHGHKAPKHQCAFNHAPAKHVNVYHCN